VKQSHQNFNFYMEFSWGNGVHNRPCPEYALAFREMRKILEEAYCSARGLTLCSSLLGHIAAFMFYHILATYEMPERLALYGARSASC
jgi:hypothetical protein